RQRCEMRPSSPRNEDPLSEQRICRGEGVPSPPCQYFGPTEIARHRWPNVPRYWLATSPHHTDYHKDGGSRGRGAKPATRDGQPLLMPLSSLDQAERRTPMKTLIAAASLVSALAVVPAEAGGLRLGLLICTIEGGTGYVIGSNKTIECGFKPSRGG